MKKRGFGLFKVERGEGGGGGRDGLREREMSQRLTIRFEEVVRDGERLVGSKGLFGQGRAGVKEDDVVREEVVGKEVGNTVFKTKTRDKVEIGLTVLNNKVFNRKGLGGEVS